MLGFSPAGFSTSLQYKGVTALGVDVGKVGLERDSEEFRVSTARLAQFAEALGDTIEAQREGKVAHPVFHHVPVMQSMVELLKSATPEFALHGEHDFHFHRAIEPGQRLFTVSKLIGIRPTKAGATLIIRSDIATHDQLKVSTQYSTCLVTSEKSAKAAGDPAPDRPVIEREGEGEPVTLELSPDQAFNYAEAARDYSPYTLDKAAAGELGFPAPILHGMCTMGIAARAVLGVACRGDARKLFRLGGRFSAPVLMVPGQSLTTRVWLGAVEGARRLVAFETTEKSGELAIKSGFAEVSA